MADSSGVLPHLVEGRRLGATVDHSGDRPTTRFEVWAPNATTLHLHLDRSPAAPAAGIELSRTGEYWSVQVPGAGHGTRYRYSIDGVEPLPDPASAWQPEGVHGASAVVDTSQFAGGFAWTDDQWRGVTLERSVIYELHVGTFTPQGTFAAAARHFPRLAELGVTTLEVMPVNAFPGERNWGYDGVFPFAVQHSYGGPEELARFVDAAHAHGLAVVLDVVYNHLGPEGNVLGRYAPYFTGSYQTPWGDAVNVMGPGSDGVRRYVSENVHRWITDFHVDGLRLDAVHAIIDTSANPFWEEIAAVAHHAGRARRRPVLVIAESSDNDPRYVRAADRGGFGHDAVWNDDLHHSLRVGVTGERTGYYADYEGSAAELADVFEHRWTFRGRFSTPRGRRHGRPVDDVAVRRFVVCSQNHDQIGNRPAGERLDHHTTPDDRRLVAAVVLLSPFTPMLFMGEEYGEPAPFPFFVDHRDPAILEATRTGRREEFRDADWGSEVPDPADPATFRAAVLDVSLSGREPHRSLLAMYTDLLRLRREMAPLTSPQARQQVQREGDLVIVHRWLDDRSATMLVVNLGHTSAITSIAAAPVQVVFDSHDTRWGGHGSGISILDDDPIPTGTDNSKVAVTGRAVGLISTR